MHVCHQTTIKLAGVALKAEPAQSVQMFCGAQALWWAWSHAQRMKGLPQSEHTPSDNPSASVSHSESCDTPCLSNSTQEALLQSSTGSPDGFQTPSRQRQSLQSHRLSVSAQQYTSQVAPRIRQSIEGFDYMQEASPYSSPSSFCVHEDDLQDELADEPCTPALDQRQIRQLQCLWTYHLQLANASAHT